MEGTCPRAAPQLDLKTFRAFAATQQRQQQPTKSQLSLMQTWADFKAYLPASCLAKCEDAPSAPVTAPLMWSDKYKFVWIQPPRALGANVAKLLKEFKELEIQTGPVEDAAKFKDYKIISGVRDPMKLFLARYEGLLQNIDATSAAAQPKAVGTVLSDLMQKIWPGCESTIDGSKKLELAAHELAPVFLQWGGRPVDFIIHAETPEDDLRLFFKEIGISNDVARPRLVKKPERALKQSQEAVQQTIMNDKEILQAFCTVYSVDFMSMGYEAEFERICGSTQPARTTVRATQLKEALAQKTPEEPRALVQVKEASCNIAAAALLTELPFVDSAEVCKAHCEAEDLCLGFEHDQSRAVCLLSKSHPDMSSAKDSTCGAACQDSDDQLAANLPDFATTPRCSELQHFCDSRTVARFCPATCRSCEGTIPRLAPGLISYGQLEDKSDIQGAGGVRKQTHRRIEDLHVEQDALEDMVTEMKSETAEEKTLEEDMDMSELLPGPAPKKFQVAEKLTVHVHPNPRAECFPSKNSQKPYVLLAVWKSPGSETTTMAEKYAMTLADQCSIHELHTFDATEDMDQMDQIKAFYKTYHTKFPTTVVLKADENTVYMDVKAFDKAVAYAASHPEYDIMVPNKVNSAAGTFYQRQQGCLSEAPHGVKLINQESMQSALYGETDLKALVTHEQFLKNASCFKWRASQSCLALPKSQGAAELDTFIVRLSKLQDMRPENACMYPEFNTVNLRLDASKHSAADKHILRLYDALFGKITAGESAPAAAKSLAGKLSFDDASKPQASTATTGAVCHKAAPQLDLSTCRAFGARSHQVVRDLKQWASVEDYVPAQCLTSCKDEETALAGEMLYSDKYKFVWLQPPKAMGSSLEKLLKQWPELEVKTASATMDADKFRDYMVISSTREPLALFQSRLGEAATDKKHVGEKLSTLLQQIWPGCGSTDSSTMDIAPVFLQLGGRKVDFLVREEFIEEDLEALWEKIGVSKKVSWPKLVRKSEKSDVSLLTKTLDDHVDIRKAFCAAYSVDYMCFGYENKFQEICGSVDPKQINIIEA